MATADDRRTPYESRGDGEKSRKRPFRPELNEEPRNVLQEAWQNNSTWVSDQSGKSASISVTVGISELEEMLKQLTFTRSETHHLIELLHSRTCDEVVAERDATEVLPIIRPVSSQQNPATIENLPGDVLQKIFIRLLAKQLAQMRCVSKSWNALLSQSSFIKSHLHRSINTNDQILVAFYGNHNKVFTPFYSQPPHHELANFIKIPRVKPGHTFRSITIIGSVHGLICSRYTNDVIHIWNPSLRAVLTLPPYSFPYCGCYEISFRFGYDPVTEDYKVVKIAGVTRELNQDENETSEDEDDVPSFLYVIEKWLDVEIYSMRKGSWKVVPQRLPSHMTRIFNKDEVCVDGHDGRLHWVGHTNKKLDSEIIVAFDLVTETFCEMALPDSILDYDRSNTLGILGGKLCVMSRDGNGGIDVWVMDEYTVAESWVKRHVFCISHYLGDRLTGFTSRNEFLIDDADNCLVLYNPIADKRSILEKYSDETWSTDRIVEYVDSLIWVAPSRDTSSTSQFQF